MHSTRFWAAAPRAAALGAAAAAAVLALAACSPSGSGPAAAGKPAVVASTDVYGDLAAAIGGDKVTVTSIISATNQDPHSYEATTQDRLAVSKAKLVIENGGGYDPFVDPLVREAGLGQDQVVTAVQVAGLESGAAGTGSAAASGTPSGHAHASYNEHVWYDVSAMKKVTDAIASRLSSLDPSSKDVFEARATDVTAKLAAMEARLADLKSQTRSGSRAKVAMTEPVPFYLLQAAGLTDATPEAFSAAIEEEQDVPPAVLKETLDLVSSRSVAFLAYNPQTQSPQTEQLRKAAETAKVPVVEFTETVPAGQDYLSWMQANVAAVAKALS